MKKCNSLKGFFVIVIMSSCFSLYSQSEKVSIKFSPLPLIDDIGFPTIQGGIEIKLSKQLSWYNEVGIKYRECMSEANDTNFVASRGYKLRSELRYYLSKNKKTSLEGLYMAFNTSFSQNYHNPEITYYPNKDSSISRKDGFGVKKEMLDFNILCGFQKKLYKGLSIDAYGGLGIRFRNVTNYHKEFDKKKDSIDLPIDFSILSIREVVDANGGKTVVPIMLLGIRVCYNF